MKSKLVILLYAIVSVIIVLNEDKASHNQYTNDKCGYYLYLPATFIYHDLKKLSFYPYVDSLYNNSLDIQYSLHRVNGNMLDKYPVGVAIFELPFFLAANYYCKHTTVYHADGYSLPYQVGGIACNIFWVLLGLLILRNFIRRYFNDNVTALTILCIAFGTNLYAYTSFDIGMSHPYSFFLFSCLINLTDSIYNRFATHHQHLYLFALSGIVAGLIVIVRPINIIACIIPVFWKVADIASLKERIKLFAFQYKYFLVAVVGFLMILFIQLFYWKYITGHWIYYSYQEEGFDFLHPNIWKGLFSYRKGWFIYTPMALLGLIGFYHLHKKNRTLTPTLCIFFAAMIFCVFSWKEWWYGGSFGCRPLIESLAFLSMPLGAFIEYISNNSSKVIKASGYTIAGLLIVLNLFQTYQYSMGLIHWSRMTREYYMRVFGKIDFDRVKNEKYLLRENPPNSGN